MKFIDKFKLGIWNIGIIKKSIDVIMRKQVFEIQWMKHKYKDRFFADPFLLKKDDSFYYILAEELIFHEEKGRIVLLTIDDRMRLRKKEYIIDEAFHLSYPFVYRGMIIPEAHKSGKVYSYTIDGDKLVKNVVADFPVIDPTIITYKNNTYLFGTTKEKVIDSNSKLSIYILENGKYVPFSSNPVKNDCRSSRPGGHFFEYEGSLYRPAQDCEKLYGEQIRIMEVLELRKDCYVEKEKICINSFNSNKYNIGLHTFNVEDKCIIVDGFHYKRKFIYAFLNAKCKKMLMNFENKKEKKAYTILCDNYEKNTNC